MAGTTGAAVVAFAKARRDEGPSALLRDIEREDSSGTIRKVYGRVKVGQCSTTAGVWGSNLPVLLCCRRRLQLRVSLLCMCACGSRARSFRRDD